MKIIEKKEWAHEFTCKSCESRLEANHADIMIGRFGGDYMESGERMPYVVCPVCGLNKKMQWSEVPPNLEGRS